MHKLIISFILAVLVFQTHAQIVIKRCADGSTVGGNSSCPSNSSGSSRAPVYKNWDMYGAIAIDVVNGKGWGGGVARRDSLWLKK